MKRDWKKDRAAGAKHARLIKRKPELREQLYGGATVPRRDQENRPAREIATEGNDNG